jgi:prepilin-type N-terminal cleavage/methylation domain-containing protein
MTHARSARGFTLIELMISVAVVGILATIAIPAFNKYTLRAKTTERMTIMMRIRSAVQDYYLRNGTVVPLDSDWNPPEPPTQAKRSMLTNKKNWNTYFPAPGGGSSLPQEIEGAVYYSYRFVVTDTPASGSLYVYAEGDLDGDGVPSYKQLVFTRVTGTYMLDPSQEYPPPGEEDDASSYATF